MLAVARLSGRSLVAALAIVLVAPVSHAAALGNPEGAVLIGRPLDLTFSATGHPDGEAPCLEAELMHGEARIDPRRVQLQWVPGPQGRATVHVRSAVRVFEPVVTLTLRVGCLRELTRRYVLLADPVADVEPAIANVPLAPPVAAAPAVPPAPAAAVPAAEGTSPGTAGTSVPRAGIPAAGAEVQAAAPVARVPARPRRATQARPQQRAAASVARQQAATPRRSAVAAPPAAGPTKPRLVLDPLETAPQAAAAPGAAAAKPGASPATAPAAAASPASPPASLPGGAVPAASSDEAAQNALGAVEHGNLSRHVLAVQADAHLVERNACGRCDFE